MSAIDFSWRGAFPSLAAAVCLLVIFPAVAAAQSRFTVNGVPVDAGTYRAAVLVNEANTLVRQNKAEEAVVRLKQALYANPKLAEPRCNLGLILARLGRAEEAVAQLEQAIYVNPELGTAYLNLATVHQTAGKVDEAIASYEMYLEKFPDGEHSAPVKGCLALLRSERERRQRAGSRAAGAVADDYFPQATVAGFSRWPAARMPLKVYISSGEGLPGYRDYYAEALRDAFQQWEAACDRRVGFRFVDNPVGANIKCSWTDNPEKLKGGSEDGEAQVEFLGGCILRTNIVLSTHSSNMGFPQTEHLIRAVCLHEIGHALGCLGHSTNPDDVMFFSAPIEDRPRVLTARDINTMRRIYDTPMDAFSQLVAEIDVRFGNARGVLVGAIIALGLFVLPAMAFLIWAATRGGGRGRRRAGRS